MRAASTLAAIGLLLAACGSDSTAQPPAPAAPTSSTTTSTTAPETAVVDWDRRTVSGLEGEPFDVAFCEGDAPLVCFTEAGEPVGSTELWSTSADDLDVLAGREGADALRALAEDLVDSFRADRAEGCGPDYEVVPDDVAPASFAGLPGLRYGFRGVVDGKTVEHVIVHGTIDDGTVWLLNAAGYAEGGCLPDEGGFTVEAVEAAEPTLARIAAGTVLPAGLP